jgi:hypothetical protein
MRRTVSTAGLLGLVAAMVLPLGVRSAADDKAGQWGTVKGQVIFQKSATIPTPQQLNVTKDQQHCLSKGPLLSEEWVVNPKNRGVRWTFVWLTPEKDGPPLAVHPDLKEIKVKEVTVDQPCCQFVPHALAMREGQHLVAKNSAPVAHNVHVTGHPLKNPGTNPILPAGQSVTVDNLKADKYPVKLSCDIHGWMSAWIRIFDNPYYALTDEDGNFEIKQAPAGNYRLVVWHETGWGPGGKDGTKVTIKPNGETVLDPIELKP